VVEEASVGSFKARIRTMIMGEGMSKLAMESFAVCVIPSDSWGMIQFLGKERWAGDVGVGFEGCFPNRK
jgi:hypothetical protein